MVEKKFLSIAEAMKKGKGKVSVRGWVHRERGSNKIKFIVLRDVSNVIQCVLERKKLENKWEDIDKIQVEYSLEIQGSIKEDKRAPSGYEISVDDLKIVGESDTFPIQKDQNREFLDDHRHLWLRSRKMQAIMKIRHTVLAGFREHYTDQGYFEFSPPILQPTQCEGGSTLFPVKYYDNETYLSQSAQLYSEAFIFCLEKIFLIGPTFRAEKSKTSRHLSEFWMAEIEAAWMNFDEMLDDIEAMMKHIIKKVLEDNKAELKILERDLSKLKPSAEKPFKRMTYDEVLKFLKQKEKMDVPWGKDLRTIEEDRLSKHFDVPIIVTRYPKEIMAFYKLEDPKNKKAVLCVDVISPEGYGELIGGSQRSLDVQDMIKRLKKGGENPEHYSWYFDLRKYGSVPHSGYGLGVERFVSWICGLDNVKDTIPFPRTMLRYKP
jgi:asparaginyl-tRNA synthetase